jgi:uncharacterized membrane protein
MWFLDNGILPISTFAFYILAASMTAIFGVQIIMPVLTLILLLLFSYQFSILKIHSCEMILSTKKRE